MNKQTTPNAAISRHKILIGCVYMVAAATLLAIDAANLKQGDDPMTPITTGAVMAQTQSKQNKNRDNTGRLCQMGSVLVMIASLLRWHDPDAVYLLIGGALSGAQLIGDVGVQRA